MLPGIAGLSGLVGETAAAPTDPNFSSTVLLMGFNGSNGSTTFTDESFVARGNAGGVNDAQITTSTVKFGTGSLRLDGTLDRIYYADSADWNFGSGDFTVEMWVLISSLASLDADMAFISQWATTGSQRSWLLQYNGSLATNTLSFVGSSAGSSGTTLATANWTPTQDQFYHVAVDRSGNVFRLYIDGVMVGTSTNAFTFHNSTTDLRIGNVSSAGVETNLLRGNIDELRITKGVARYASDSGFTVPTAAFPRS